MSHRPLALLLALVLAAGAESPRQEPQSFVAGAGTLVSTTTSST